MSTRPGSLLPDAWVETLLGRVALGDLVARGRLVLIVGERAQAWRGAAGRIATERAIPLDAFVIGGSDLADVVAHTGLTVGSPAQVADKVLATRERFGDYRRQLFGLEHSGLPEGTVHEMIDLLGAEVRPSLRAESGLVAGRTGTGDVVLARVAGRFCTVESHGPPAERGRRVRATAAPTVAASGRAHR